MPFTYPTDLVNTRGLSGDNLGWRDLIGDVAPKATGAGRATLNVFQGTTEWFSFAAGDQGGIVFHIPHDYAVGTDMFLHVHWSHNGTAISGTFDMAVEAQYAKGHQQADFSTPVTSNIAVAALDLTKAPQYRHRIDEVPLSIAGGSASTLDTADIEVDGVILIQFDMTTIPTITGGTGEPFIFTLDIHYQSDRAATLNKVPDFYV